MVPNKNDMTKTHSNWLKRYIEPEGDGDTDSVTEKFTFSGINGLYLIK